jgi:hypothetical protein
MKLPAPYYSQFVDITDPFWMLRACGACSLKVAVESHGVSAPDLLTLCNEAQERGGYDIENGWVHDYLVTKAQELGLQAYRKEGITDLTEVISFLKQGNPVIVSVEKRVLEQTRFHLITLVGYETNGSASNTTSYRLQATDLLYYHESESTNKEKGAYRVCSVETFSEYFRGKAIFISR